MATVEPTSEHSESYNYVEPMSFLLDALPDASAAPWCNDPAALSFLLKLAATPQDELASTPAQLEMSRARVLEETQRLAFENYKTFIQTAHCTTDIFKDFTQIESATDSLLENLPIFSASCREFLDSAQQINDARKKNSLTLHHHQQVLEILEIPQLMDTCVRNSYYEEALQLQAHVTRLHKRHTEIRIIKSISEDVQRCASQMQANLISQLRSDIQLPACLRIIGYLRRLHVFTELELRIQFLKARDSWLQKVLSSIPSKDSYMYITKTVETSRVHLFDIITQYKAVFSHPIERDVANNSEGLLSGWILQRVTEFLESLGDHLPRLTDRFHTVLGQCMHFALSLGRVGLDFRALLPPLFERAILDLFVARIEMATAEFIEDMPSMALVSHPTIVDMEGNDAASDAPIAPLSLMAYPILAKLTNNIISALNDLRECAPVAISIETSDCLAKNLLAVSNNMQRYYDNHSVSFDPRESSTFTGLAKLFLETMVPCIVRCVDAIYPEKLFQSGSSLVPSQKTPSSCIDRTRLAVPLKAFCAEARALVVAAANAEKFGTNTESAVSGDVEIETQEEETTDNDGVIKNTTDDIATDNLATDSLATDGLAADSGAPPGPEITNEATAETTKETTANTAGNTITTHVGTKQQQHHHQQQQQQQHHHLPQQQQQQQQQHHQQHHHKQQQQQIEDESDTVDGGDSAATLSTDTVLTPPLTATPASVQPTSVTPPPPTKVETTTVTVVDETEVEFGTN